MTITLYLKPEQEELLRVIAQTSGVSVEGYLLTLIEAIVDPRPVLPPKGVLAAVQRLRNPAPAGTQARIQADDAVHQMRANVLVHQEKAVEAVTRMNLLRTTTEQQQRRIAHSELQALTYARDGNEEAALHAYQESCIYGLNLQQTRILLEEVTQNAEKLLGVFRREETNLKARLAAPHATALAAIQSKTAKSDLSEAQMQARIEEEASPEQWQEQFRAWVGSMARAGSDASISDTASAKRADAETA